MRRGIAITTAAAILVTVAIADDFWANKPFQQWSKAETDRMLKDSPWAQHITLSEVAMNTAGISTSSGGRRAGVTGLGSVEQNAESEHSSMPNIVYIAQVRSAQPIREAVVRDRQLQEKYDKMSADQKAALDKKTDAYLSAPQEDIVIYVTFESNVRQYNDLLRRYWTQQTYDLVKNSVRLKLGKDWREPTSYAATNGAFQFTFDRAEDLPRDAELVLQFQHPDVGAIKTQRVNIEFKAEKMVLDGKLAM